MVDIVRTIVERVIFLRRLVCALVFFFCTPFALHASSNASFDNALNACQNYSLADHYGAGVTGETCVVNASNHSVDKAGTLANGVSRPGTPSSNWGDWTFSGDVPESPATCTAGQIFAAGTTYKDYGSSQCAGGCEMELSMVIGSASFGAHVMSGNACPVSDGASSTDKAVQPVTLSETRNADGSETYCDTNSGKCVTASPPTVDAPAPSSSSHSTDSTSTTTTAATTTTNSSTSTTTTTSTDGGASSGGTGDGGGSGVGSTSTTTTTGQTDKPASSSSTSTKCTTGVCDVGDADGNIGSVYTAGTDTPSSVYINFKSQVSSAPIIASATAFFTVNVSGSCPSWHIPGNKWWGEAGFDFAFFCDPAFLAILTLAGYLVLAVASFSAFRIALY